VSLQQTLARNTAYNVAGRFWEAVVALILTPYIIERIGMASWGIWALLGAFTGYVALFDLGIASGFSKFVAQHAARSEPDEVSSVVSTGLFTYLGAGVVLVLIGWPCIDFLIGLLGRLDPRTALDFTNPEFLSEARFLLRWGLVLFATSNCVSAFTAVQTGLQRMDVTNILSFVASLFKIAATVFFIEQGMGVRSLLYVNAVVLAVFGAASVAVAFRLAPSLRVSLFRVRLRTFSRLYSFGWRSQVARLSNLIMFQTDAVVVAVAYKFLGIVGLYDVGVGLANKMRQIPALLVSALLPAASDLDAREEHDRLRRLYLVSSKYLAAVTIPLVLFTVGAAGPLMRAWMGEKRDLHIAVWVLRIIAFGYLANILPGAGVSIVLGKGRPDIQMKAGLIAMAANVVLTIALVFAIGFYGIPLGTMFAMFVAWFWFLRVMRHTVPVSCRELLSKCLLWPALAAAPGFLFCAACDWLTQSLSGRFVHGGVAAGSALVFAFCYLLVIRYSPFLDASDLAFLEGALRLGRVPGVRWFLAPARERV